MCFSHHLGVVVGGVAPKGSRAQPAYAFFPPQQLKNVCPSPLFFGALPKAIEFHTYRLFNLSSRYVFRQEMCPLQPKSNHMYKGAWEANNSSWMGKPHWEVKNMGKYGKKHPVLSGLVVSHSTDTLCPTRSGRSQVRGGPDVQRRRRRGRVVEDPRGLKGQVIQVPASAVTALVLRPHPSACLQCLRAPCNASRSGILLASRHCWARQQMDDFRAACCSMLEMLPRSTQKGW